MIVGLLLAAGGARRFGSQKLVALLDETPLVRHAAVRLASATDALVVVVGNDAGAVRGALHDSGARFVDNPDWASGLASSLRRGVESFGDDVDAVVVMLGDEPRVDAAIVQSVIAEWRASRAAIVQVRYRGTRGHPVLFDRSAFAELLELRGDVGAKQVIDRSPDRVRYVDVDENAPLDVDTKADLDRVEQ